MGLVSLFTDFSSEMMNPLLPIFLAGLVGGGMAALYVGVMEGIAETTASLLKIFSGRISDRLGKRKELVILGYGLSSIARPMMALAGLLSAATGGIQVIVLKFFDRIGKGIRTSPRDALIGDSVAPEVRGLAFSFHRSMDHLGAVLGPIVAILILWGLLGPELWSHPAVSDSMAATPPEQMSSLRWLFAIALLPGLAAMASLIWKVREIAPKRKAGPAGRRPDCLAASTSSSPSSRSSPWATAPTCSSCSWRRRSSR
jgi:MFS-type transporter involved in bile tolerance (Atg22 family)